MSSNRYWYVLAFLVLLIGNSCCSSAPVLNNPSGIPRGQQGHASILISADFSEGDVKLIKAGVDIWVKASRGLYTVEYVPLKWSSISNNKGDVLASQRCKDVIVFEMLTSFDEIVMKHDKRKNQTTLGIGSHDECDISRAGIVADRIHSDHVFKMVAAHEFGHAMGLDHVDTRGSIMFHSINKNTKPCVQLDDAAEFCSHLLCRPEELAYCKPEKGCAWKMPDPQ
jgi:hypothetical protein